MDSFVTYNPVSATMKTFRQLSDDRWKVTTYLIPDDKIAAIMPTAYSRWWVITPTWNVEKHVRSLQANNTPMYR